MNIFTGIYQLITSPSGFFALICLTVLSVLSWHLGIAWVTAAAAAWSAFFAVIPAALGYFEHKETMVQLQAPPTPILVTPVTPVVPAPPNPSATVTVSTTMSSTRNLPPRGTL